jgi:hypothetical protein
MSPITSIEMFLAQVRTCPAPQHGQALERRITSWLAYYRSLQFVRERYGQLNTTYIQAIHRYLQTRERLASEPDLSSTAQQAQAEAHALYHTLQEKYVSFYTFATGLLDSIADTLQCYFGLGWTRSEITHARLTRDFPILCVAQGLIPVPTALPTLMREMQAAIETAHPSLTPLIDEHPEERLLALSTAINVYIAAIMHFFARNVEHSVLRSALAERRAPMPANHTGVSHSTP